MKSASAGYWLVLASILLTNLMPVQAQDSVTTTSTTTATTTPVATTTKKHHFKYRKAKKAKNVRSRRHKVSGRNLSGGVSKKNKMHKNKTYKPYSSAQDKRLDKLNSALQDPKQYKKIPELSTPGGANSTPSAPGI